jgi:hypothetical protein
MDNKENLEDKGKNPIIFLSLLSKLLVEALVPISIDLIIA